VYIACQSHVLHSTKSQLTTAIKPNRHWRAAVWLQLFDWSTTARKVAVIAAKQCKNQQELSYRKQIARQLRTQYVECIHRPKYYTVTLKSRLRVTVNGTIGQIIHYLLLVELFDVEYYRDVEMWVRGHSRSLKVVPFESLHGYCFLFAFISNHGCICNHFGYIQRQSMAWPWNMGLGSVKIIENHNHKHICKAP